MAGFVKGDVVIVPFPFSDLTQAKRRPALVVTPLEGDDVILCQKTSQWTMDSYAIPLDEDDFAAGGLKQRSHVRPNRIFTAGSSIILYRAGSLKHGKNSEMIEKMVSIIRQ